jgi:transcriptional regulator with XRE-family HTH domain|nr:MAG TPA: helix-turn-helix domain protein [Caudoviricetes sp.]
MRNVERAKKIATEKGINVSFVCREVGKSRGYISQMLVSGRDFPDEMLAPVANALGVPVEELTGEEQKEKPAPGGSELDADVKAKAYTILDKLSKLPAKQQEAFLNSLDISIDAALNMMGGNGNG